MWDLGPDGVGLLSEAKRIADEARRRNLVLFLGAGVSAGAGLPAWQALLDDIARDLGDDLDLAALHDLDFRDQATVLHKRLERSGRSIGTEIGRRFGGTRYALSHALLASLPTR